MSDQDEPIEGEIKARAIDPNRLMKSFLDKGAKAECPVCEKTAWNLRSGPGTTGITLSYGDERGSMYMFGYPAVCMVCKNCGFMRLHTLDMYRDCLVEDGDGTAD